MKEFQEETGEELVKVGWTRGTTARDGGVEMGGGYCSEMGTMTEEQQNQ